MTKPLRDKTIVLGQLLEGLNQSSGAAGLLIHHQQNVNWMKTRAILEAVKRMVIAYSVEPMLKPKEKEKDK